MNLSSWRDNGFESLSRLEIYFKAVFYPTENRATHSSTPPTPL